MLTRFNQPRSGFSATAGPFRSGQLAVAAVTTFAVTLGYGIAAGGAHVVLVSVAAMFGLYGAIVGLVRPKLLVVASALVVLLVQTAEQLTHVSRLSILEDASIALAVAAVAGRCIATGRPLRAVPGMRFFGGFLLFGVASSVYAHVPLSIAVAGGFAAAKGFLFGIAVAQLDWGTEDVRRGTRWGAAAVALAVGCGLANFVAPSFWTSHFVAGGRMDVRVGLPALVGPFTHAQDYGQVMALAAIALAGYGRVFPSRLRGRWIVLGVTAVAALLSLRRKTILALGLGVAAVMARMNRLATLTAAALIVPTAAVLLWGQIGSAAHGAYDQYVAQTSGQAARTVLYRDSARIAYHDFPFGAGFGRFGSHTAIAHYSPLYSELGFTKVYGLQPGAGAGQFASDTSWPAFVGETGFLGAAFYLFALLALFRRAWSWSNASNRDPYLRWLGLVLAGWSIEYLVESLAAPVYVAPPEFALIFLVAGVGVALQARQPIPRPSLEGRAVLVQHET